MIGTVIGSSRLMVTKIRPLEEMSSLKQSQGVKRVICVYIKVPRIYIVGIKTMEK